MRGECLLFIEQPSAGSDAQEQGEKGIATTIGEGGSGGLSRPNSLDSTGKEAQASQAVLGRKMSMQVFQQRHGTFRYKK